MFREFCFGSFIICLFGVVAQNILEPGIGFDVIINSITCGCNRPEDLDVSDLTFHYCNFATDPSCEGTTYKLNEFSRIRSRDDFDSNQCFHIFIPGFLNNILSEVPQEVICSFKNHKCNSLNVVLMILDTSPYLSGNPLEKLLNRLGLYVQAVKHTKSIAKALALFLCSLLGVVPRDNVFVTGHSLGGQVAGMSGYFVQKCGQFLKTIFGVDPAGPCYKDCIEEHIKRSQAETVIALHCNSGGYGTYLNLTDFDVYAGDGEIQKACRPHEGSLNSIEKLEASNCSHYKCVPIALQTVIRSGIYTATRCNSSQDFRAGDCSGNSQSVIALEEVPAGPRGNYFFEPETEDLPCEITIY